MAIHVIKSQASSIAEAGAGSKDPPQAAPRPTFANSSFSPGTPLGTPDRKTEARLFLEPNHRHEPPPRNYAKAYDLVAAALSSEPECSVQAGISLGQPAECAQASRMALLQAEAVRADGADVVAIMAPNDSHFELSIVALTLGFDVICDRPMTNTR